MELNKVFIAGNLGRDPQFKSTTSGKSILDFSLAVNQRARAGEEPDVLWVDVTVWDKQAEWGRNYLKKGTAVLVEGRLKMEKWTDKTTQQPRSKLAVVAERIQFAERKADSQQADRTDEPRGEYQRPAQTEARAEDLPF